MKNCVATAFATNIGHDVAGVSTVRANQRLQQLSVIDRLACRDFRSLIEKVTTSCRICDNAQRDRSSKRTETEVKNHSAT